MKVRIRFNEGGKIMRGLSWLCKGRNLPVDDEVSKLEGTAAPSLLQCSELSVMNAEGGRRLEVSDRKA